MARTTTLKGKALSLSGPELKAGDKAPDFTAVTNSLEPTSLGATGSAVRIFSVVPSLDTPVCDLQTKRFNDELAKLTGIDIYTISMDLPFAQSRWSAAMDVKNVKMISDHKDGAFGKAYGTLIDDLRIESRAIFVVGKDNSLKHVEYVSEVAEHPNYDAALAAAKAAAE